MPPRISEMHARTGILAPIFSIALLLFTVGVALPSTLYRTNAREFSITLGDLLLVAIPTLVVCLAIVALLVRLVPAMRQPRVVAALFAVALLIWFQGSVMVWQYGPLDGREIDWSAHQLHGLVDSVVWLTVLGLALWKPGPIAASATFVSASLILLQLFTIVAAGVQAPPVRTAGTIKEYTIDAAPKFSFSRDRNAILVVLDEVQSDVFQEIVDNDLNYRRVFDGFTYFPDAVAGANYTELAIPALLTGRLYDNSVPKDLFLADAYRKDSVFALLKRSHFRVDMYPWVGWGNETILFDDSIVDNLTRREGTTSESSRMLTEKEAKEIIYLADLALFRSVPHFVKPAIYNNQRWFLMDIVSRFVPDEVKMSVSTDNEFETTVFAEQADREMRVDTHGDSFKYYHLKGAHSPLTVRADLTVSGEPVPFTRENYVLQLKASLRALDVFFEGLKRLRVWDRTLIIVVADHGSGHTKEMYLRSTVESRPGTRPGVARSTRLFAKDKARGIPLVLVKRIDAAGPMATSDAPVSNLDVPATVAAELELRERPRGASMFATEPRRIRRYGAFEYSENKTNYVGAMTLYAVAGKSWDDRSWTIEDVLVPAIDGTLPTR